MKLRGLFPSLGAGGSLIAAAACAFVVLGGVLAFRGENPGTAEANSGSVVVPGATRGVQKSSPGAVDGVVALADAGRRTARPRPVRRRGQTRGSTLRNGSRTPPSTGRTPSVPAPAETPADDDDRASAPDPTPTPAAPQAPAIPSGTVQRAVEQTRGAVQPVVDTVPEPVQAPVERVADTVQEVAGTVDETVDGLTGTLLPKP